MKKWIARSVLILIAMALYIGVFWWLPISTGSSLAGVAEVHSIIGAIVLVSGLLIWAIDNCEW